MQTKCLEGAGLSVHIMTPLMPSWGLGLPPVHLLSLIVGGGGGGGVGSHSEQPMSETPPDAEEDQLSLLVEEKHYLHFINPLDANQGLSTEDGFCDAQEKLEHLSGSICTSWKGRYIFSQT